MSSTVTPKDAKTPAGLNLYDVEMVYGTPDSPKAIKPDVHIVIEKKPKESSLTFNNGLENNNKHDSEALLESEKEKPTPPLAGPEIDDLGEKPEDTSPFPGIDEGLLDPFSDGDGNEVKDTDGPATPGEGETTNDGKLPLLPDETDGPYDELAQRSGFDGPKDPSLDFNTYQQKKNLAQGMMDLALLSANANQLRYVIESSSGGHPYYYFSIVFISLSIILQVAVGIGLIMNSRYNPTDDNECHKADRINNMTVLGIFLITVVNVFISSFSVAPTSTGIAAGGGIIQQAGV